MRKQKEQQVLTKGEMDIMKLLWEIGSEASVKDILERSREPKPAYTTIATFLKILKAKGYLEEDKRENCGKTLFYKPVISQDEYTRRIMNDVTTNFFGGSVSSLVNFFVREEKITHEEVLELLNMIETE